MASISNLDMQIDDIDSRYRVSFKDAAGNPLTAEAAKAKIKEDNRLHYFAANAARTNAAQLIQLFFETHKTNGPITNQLVTRADLGNSPPATSWRSSPPRPSTMSTRRRRCSSSASL